MTPEQIKKWINQIPPDALPEILAQVVKACIIKQVYKGRNIWEIVRTIEMTLRGQKTGQPPVLGIK